MRIAAFDMDGTIYIDHQIAPATAQAIKDWQAAGNLAIAATGKSLDPCRNALRSGNLTMDFHLLNNGTVLTDRNFDILIEQHVPDQLVYELLDTYAGTKGLNIYVASMDRPDRLLWRGIDGAHPFIPHAREVPLTDVRLSKVVLLALWAPGKQALLEEIAQWAQNDYHLEISFNSGLLDMMPPGNDKGVGIGKLLAHLNLTRDQVELYTFGDSYNDLPMHMLADASFSFPWAPNDMQSQVTHVIDDVPAGLQALLSGKV